MKTIRWGIISTGKITRQFINDFQFTTGGEIKAVASRDLDKARTYAEEFRIPKAHGSYEALCDDKEVDVIYVATPHNFHFQNTVDALQAGKSVLCEKPITINVEEMKELQRIAANSGQYLMEAMWTYFLPTIQKAQSWVHEGRIGKIIHLKTDFGFPPPFVPEGRLYNPELAGGSLLDIGIYPIAMANLFLGSEYQDLHVLGRRAPTGVDDDLVMVFNYGENTATLTCSFRCKLHNYAFIIGEKGYIMIPNFWKTTECYLYQGEEVVDHFTDDRAGKGFEFEIQAVNQDIQAGRTESQIMPLNRSMQLQVMMESVRSKIS